MTQRPHLPQGSSLGDRIDGMFEGILAERERHSEGLLLQVQILREKGEVGGVLDVLSQCDGEDGEAAKELSHQIQETTYQSALNAPKSGTY